MQKTEQIDFLTEFGYLKKVESSAQCACQEGEKTINEIASSYEVLSSMESLIPLFKFSQ